jgi:hypothetical protein
MFALLIGYESVSRFLAPVPIHFAEAIPIACLGLPVNVGSAWLSELSVSRAAAIRIVAHSRQTNRLDVERLVGRDMADVSLQRQRLMQARLHLLASELHRSDDPVMRDQAAGVEFGEDAGQAEPIPKPCEVIGDHSRPPTIAWPRRASSQEIVWSRWAPSIRRAVPNTPARFAEASLSMTHLSHKLPATSTRFRPWV